jgi:hypothetical protein
VTNRPSARHSVMRSHRWAINWIVILVVGCGSPAGTSIEANASDHEQTPTQKPAEPIATPSSPPMASTESTEGPRSPGWVAAAPMPRDRQGFDAVLLGDGTVLVVGDDFACYPGGAVAGSETAEVYDPSTNTWSDVESLNKPRKSFATVALGDGTALVAGGVNADDVPYSSTWVLDPTTRTWRSGGLLHEARAEPVMTALSDGRALILGGRGVGVRNYLSTAEIFDPKSSSWTTTGSLPPRVAATNVVGLGDGGAVALGYDSTDTEPVRTTFVFDASDGTWTHAEAIPNAFGFELVSLGEGRALAIGGNNGGELEGGDGSVIDLVSRFDSTSGRWRVQAPMSTPRIGSQATSLADGRVLVAGGAVRATYHSGELISTTEVFDPATEQWTAVGDLLEPRQQGLAVSLQDGSVLMLGGNASFNTQVDVPYCPPPLTTVERYYPR